MQCICLVGCRLPPLDGYVVVCLVLTIDVHAYCFFNLAALIMLNQQQFYLFGQIQTNQTRGQQYIDTFPKLSVVNLIALIG